MGCPQEPAVYSGGCAAGAVASFSDGRTIRKLAGRVELCGGKSLALAMALELVYLEARHSDGVRNCTSRTTIARLSSGPQAA